MALRPCLERGCPNTTSKTRCPMHERARRNAYYGPAHRRVAALLKGQPCHWCGQPTGDATEADHVDPADPNSRRVASCRPCNLRRRRGF